MKKSIIASSLCLLFSGPLAASPSEYSEAPAFTSESQEVRRALDWLAGQASDRKATRKDYEHVAGMIIERAREFFATDEEFQVFATDLVQTLRRALDQLAERVLDRSATREDYERIVDMLIGRARSVGSGSPLE